MQGQSLFTCLSVQWRGAEDMKLDSWGKVQV